MKGARQMAKTKEKALVNAELLRPYVQRAMTDPELRNDLMAAFVTARTLYGQLGKGKGVKDRVSDKGFQKDLQALVAELSTASEKLQGKKKKAHKTRNRVVLLTGVTLGVLYNPWTGQSTRTWIMDRVSGGGGVGVDELGEFESGLESDIAAAGNGTEA
jgi:hypothetical protein